MQCRWIKVDTAVLVLTQRQQEEDTWQYYNKSILFKFTVT